MPHHRSIRLQPTSKTKKGVTFQQNKIAYHVIPSAATGTFKWSSELSGYPSYNKMGFLDPGKGDSYNTVSVFQMVTYISTIQMSVE